MKLTKAEKLTLVMLSEIYDKLGIKGDIDPKFIRSAIFSDNTWGLEWEYTGLFGDDAEPNPPEVTEVVNYLDMWSFLEEAFERLDAAEKTALVEKAQPFGANVRFAGFDGNNEPEYMSIARFLVDDLARFERFKGRDLNSHMPSTGAYRRMYTVFEPIRRTLVDRGLSVDQLAEILNAKRHGY